LILTPFSSKNNIKVRFKRKKNIRENQSRVGHDTSCKKKKITTEKKEEEASADNFDKKTERKGNARLSFIQEQCPGTKKAVRQYYLRNTNHTD